MVEGYMVRMMEELLFSYSETCTVGVEYIMMGNRTKTNMPDVLSS